MELREVPHINEGGCGYAALAMYLKRGKKDQIVLLYSKGGFSCPGSMPSFYHNERYFEGEELSLDVPDHVCLLSALDYFDCEGEVDMSNYDCLHIVSENDLRKLLKNSSWSKLFDRKNVKVIEEILKIKINSFRDLV